MPTQLTAQGMHTPAKKGGQKPSQVLAEREQASGSASSSSSRFITPKASGATPKNLAVSLSAGHSGAGHSGHSGSSNSEMHGGLLSGGSRGDSGSSIHAYSGSGNAYSNSGSSFGNSENSYENSGHPNQKRFASPVGGRGSGVTGSVINSKGKKLRVVVQLMTLQRL